MSNDYYIENQEQRNVEEYCAELHENTLKALQECLDKGVSPEAIAILKYHSGV